MLSHHSKWKTPYEQDIPCSVLKEGSHVVTYPSDELQPHHHLSGVFLDEILGLASEGFKSRGSRLEADRNGLRPMVAENWVSPLLLPKVKSRK